MLPDRSILKMTKIGGNAEIVKFKCDILGDFQTSILFQRQYILRKPRKLHKVRFQEVVLCQLKPFHCMKH